MPTKPDLSGWSDKAEAQAEAKATSEFFETSLEYEKYLLDPKSERVWKDLNKDLAMGNLSDVELQAILNQEKTLRGLMGMKEALGNKVVGELFVPESLLNLYKRMPAFILAISLSKEGFKQKLMRSMTKEQIFSTKGDPEVEYKRGWFPKKKKKEGVDR